MRLVVFHYHDRPGGVRQVISRGLPQLLPRLGAVTEVVLLMGEITDPAWVVALTDSLAGVPLRTAVHPDLGYLSGGSQKIGPEARALAGDALSGKEVLVWAHNLSVGRNFPLLRDLPDWCAAAGARLWLHHHDWWWDGRWDRWADWRAAGVTDLDEALELSVPAGAHLRHWCVNRADLPWLQKRAGKAAQWVGNPLPEMALPDKAEIADAKAWLHALTHGRRVWLAPVRALRRKNLAEAILLARQQNGPACVVTTGGPSSSGEIPAWETLCQEAARHDWSFVPGVLAPGARIFNPPRPSGLSRHPSLPSLMAAADAIVMPSLQEGFGLPCLEAASLGKPLLARALPEAVANLAALGCTLPGTYDKLPVAPGSFDAARESSRLAARWALFRSGLPKQLRMEGDVIQPVEHMDFGCLSLEAQLEVLQSHASLSIALPRPQVPHWPAESRVDGWAERFFQMPFEDGQHSVDLLPGTGGQNVRPPHESLLPEVLRRFRYWQQHPLLWP